MTDATTIEQDGRRKPRETTLWVTDAEMIRRLGVPEKIARRVIKALDAQRGSGFPQKSKLWGDRRYWPAVVAFYDHHNGLNIEHPQPRRVANAR